jgi:hypothetical protein
METATLTSSSADFDDMITQFRHRLRPPPALTLADWLRVNLGLSDATEDFDFPPRNEVHRQLRAVLAALHRMNARIKADPDLMRQRRCAAETPIRNHQTNDGRRAVHHQ